MAAGGAHVRLATEADLPRLIELLVQLAPGTSGEDLGPPLPEAYRAAFREIEADQRQQLLVLEDGGIVTGTATLIIIPNVSHQGHPYGLVENVVVDQGQRGEGYGELLMRHAMAEARRAGCYKLILTSNKRRVDAHRFYERLGLEAIAEGFRIDF